MSRLTQTITIPSGSSLSDEIDCNSRVIVGFIAPAAWTTAALTIEASTDDVTWVTTLLDATLAAVGSFASITASAGYAVDYTTLMPYRYLRLRSGTSASPVNQGAARAFTVITRPLA